MSKMLLKTTSLFQVPIASIEPKVRPMCFQILSLVQKFQNTGLFICFSSFLKAVANCNPGSERSFSISVISLKLCAYLITDLLGSMEDTAA